MIGDQIAHVLTALATLLWIGLAFYVVWLLRPSLAATLGRLTGLEAFGVKLALGGGAALDAAIELADKNPAWRVDIPAADRKAAIDRASRHRAVFEGAEILWVDDCPSNNRNEARMLRSFGAMITFAVTTDEAVGALRTAADQCHPYHLILSDISRDLPQHEPTAGLAMLPRLRAAGFAQPVIFYIGRVAEGVGTPPGAFAITNRPDQLLDYVTDALSRLRG